MKHFFAIFEWNSFTEFINSMIPSMKISATIPLLTIGGFFGIVTDVMGVKFLTLLAICAALFAELVSGVYASIKRGENIRSGKFGRFVVKAFVWFMCIFIVNAFCKEFAEDKTPGVVYLMTWVRSAFLMTCFLEYMISIDENMQSITGKKSYIITMFKDKIISLITGKPSKKDDADKTNV